MLLSEFISFIKLTCHSQRHVRHAALRPLTQILTGYSEHVIIPRTENTIKCSYPYPDIFLPTNTTQTSTRSWTSSTEKSSTA